MCLFTQAGYEEVMRLLVEDLAWARRWQGSWQVPHKSSIARARRRSGPAPLRALFAEVARPLATPATKGAWYLGWRLLALDGTTLDDRRRPWPLRSRDAQSRREAPWRLPCRGRERSWPCWLRSSVWRPQRRSHR
jgi:hypothetical protein